MAHQKICFISQLQDRNEEVLKKENLLKEETIKRKIQIFKKRMAYYLDQNEHSVFTKETIETLKTETWSRKTVIVQEVRGNTTIAAYKLLDQATLERSDTTESKATSPTTWQDINTIHAFKTKYQDQQKEERARKEAEQKNGEKEVVEQKIGEKEAEQEKEEQKGDGENL